MIDYLANALGSDSRPACLTLDFEAVSGFDFSAVNVLARYLQSAYAAGVRMVPSAPSQRLRSGLKRNLPSSGYGALQFEPNADKALEHREDIVIVAGTADTILTGDRRASLLDRTADDLERHLDRQVDFEELLNELQDGLNPRQYAVGEVPAGPDVPGDGLQRLISGRASAHEADGTRLRQYGPGEMI